MAEKRVRSKYCTVPINVLLTELGNIQGPIITPCWIPIDKIRELLVRKRPVYEHAITDYHKRVKLTLENYDDFNIYPGNSAIEDPTVAPNTFIVAFKDADQIEKDYAAGTVYVELLD